MAHYHIFSVKSLNGICGRGTRTSVVTPCSFSAVIIGVKQVVVEDEVITLRAKYNSSYNEKELLRLCFSSMYTVS